MYRFPLISLAIYASVVYGQGTTVTPTTNVNPNTSGNPPNQPTNGTPTNPATPTASPTTTPTPKILAVNCTQSYFEITDDSMNGTSIGACTKIGDGEKGGSFCQTKECFGFATCQDCNLVTPGPNNTTVISNTTIKAVPCNKGYYIPGPGDNVTVTYCSAQNNANPDDYICKGPCTSFTACGDCININDPAIAGLKDTP
ncbi:hypothetical protein BY996DRAFT_4042959 [Phakopsora pachyrhizi]|uniref:Expressed protein n=1 Tax=Phakopsora pachyrhizi TaxID=170000 RepID=A0AAV0BDY3_PHAPC|nr:hypothetical protein BY996DRAFT_4042959 [Phakopsora pachyrhizi]CAH7685117.1 expressed protein [Phakopsora pachyrhizi]